MVKEITKATTTPSPASAPSSIHMSIVTEQRTFVKKIMTTACRIALLAAAILLMGNFPKLAIYIAAGTLVASVPVFGMGACGIGLARGIYLLSLAFKITRAGTTIIPGYLIYGILAGFLSLQIHSITQKIRFGLLEIPIDYMTTALANALHPLPTLQVERR